MLYIIPESKQMLFISSKGLKCPYRECLDIKDDLMLSCPELLYFVIIPVFLADYLVKTT